MDKEDTEKIIRRIDLGITDIVITGSRKDLAIIKMDLGKELSNHGFDVSTLDLEHPPLEFEIEYDKGFLFVWGLEHLDALDSRSFALRTFLDTEKHRGLRFVIFCEQESYSNHFHNDRAPFYLFCSEYQLKALN